MKRFFLFFILLILMLNVSVAQKFAFIDSKYILSQMPEYTKAQKDLDDLAETWQKEIQAKYSEIDKKYKAFQQEEILLPDETKKQRMAEIIELENNAKELQKKTFWS